MYVARTRPIGVINYPDAKGLACGYNPEILNVGGNRQGYGNFPNFVDAWFARPDGCAESALHPFVTDTLLCLDQILHVSAPWVGRPDVPFNVTVDGATLLTRTDTTADFRFSTPGSYRMVVRWSDTVNGTDSAIGFITTYPVPAASAGVDTTICEGDALLLGDPSNSNDPDIHYAWEPAELLDEPASPRPLARPTSKTTYTLHAIDARTGCDVRDTITVGVWPRFNIEASRDTTICSGNSVKLMAHRFNPGAGYHIEWTPSEGLDCDTCYSVTAGPDTTTLYQVTIRTPLGCASSDTIQVVVLGDQFSGAGDDQVICSGEAVTLGRDPSGESLLYSWTPSDGLDDALIAQPTARPKRTMTYVLEVEDKQSGCRAVDSVTVTVNEPPVADAGSDVSLCRDGSVRLGTSPHSGLTYSWQPSDGLDDPTAAEPLATPATTTVYEVKVTDILNGCIARDTVVVTVTNPLPVEAGEDLTICAGDTVYMVATVPGSRPEELDLLWSPSTGLNDPTIINPIVTPSQSTLYHLKVVNRVTGCVSFDSVRIDVRQPGVIPTYIDRNYRGLTDEPLRIVIQTNGGFIRESVDSIDVVLKYEATVMRVDATSIPSHSIGTLTDGWSVRTLRDIPGELHVRLYDLKGQGLSGAGPLLGIEGRLYVGSSEGSELQYEITSGSHCVEFTTATGYAELDTICGLNFRLIEQGLGRYSPPVINPNPVHSKNAIVEFGIGLDGLARLEVYNSSGRRVSVLVNEELPSGEYSVEWQRQSIPAGVYFLRLESGTWSRTTTVVIE